jgi:hypothetical protein
MNPDWSAGEIDVLLANWQTRSATQIAALLKPRSRNSVCAMANRLRGEGRLPARVLKHYAVMPHWNRTPPRSSRRGLAMAAALTSRAADSLAMAPCSIAELDDHRCHWPLGGFHDTAAMFCGGEVVRGRRYCAHHALVAVKG